MADTYNDADTLNALTKEVYSNGIEEVVPSATKLVKLFKFNESKKLGKDYVHPILLTLENGFTYSDENGEAFDLAAPSKANVQKATVRGHEMVLRSSTSIKNITSQSDDKNSFKRHLAFLTGNMLKSMYHRLEIQLMYGQAGLGVVNSVSGVNVVIYSYEWADAIWQGSENASIEIYSSAGALRGEGKIVSINPETYTVTLAAAIPGVVQTDVIYWKSAKVGEFKGLHSIATTSGDLFGINNAVFNLFKSNIYPVGTDATANAAVLSFEAIQKGVAKAMTKGFGEDSMTLVMNPKSWANVLNEQSALRSYDQSYNDKSVMNGASSITFASQNGKITLIASSFCKEGYAYGFSEKDLMRIGSSDVSFKHPITGEEKYFIDLPNNHGVEMRAYTDQALFCSAPARIVLFTNIKSEE